MRNAAKRINFALLYGMAPFTLGKELGVSTAEAKAMARRLASEEGVFAGTSSGANVVAALQEGGDRLPMFGDSDEGYVVDLGGEPASDGRWVLAVGSILLNRPDLAVGMPDAEPAYWLLRSEPRSAREPGDDAAAPRLASRAFPDSGYYLLQSGGGGAADDRISVLFDCGELGFKSIAAHGHADALSLCVRAFGRDILVDPGT